MRYEDEQSIIETGNALSEQIEDLQRQAKKLGIHVDTLAEIEDEDGQPLGKYIVIDRGRRLPRTYLSARTAALRLLRLLRWYREDNPIRTTAEISSLVCAQPGEPDKRLADYFLFPDGRIVRLDEETQGRIIVDYGRSHDTGNRQDA